MQDKHYKGRQKVRDNKSLCIPFPAKLSSTTADAINKLVRNLLNKEHDLLLSEASERIARRGKFITFHTGN